MQTGQVNVILIHLGQGSGFGRRGLHGAEGRLQVQGTDGAGQDQALLRSTNRRHSELPGLLGLCTCGTHCTWGSFLWFGCVLGTDLRSVWKA